ncbi:hypothetical protein JXR93_03020 [bacterium]|nr:hypothetical protein [bacterium]
MKKIIILFLFLFVTQFAFSNTEKLVSLKKNKCNTKKACKIYKSCSKTDFCLKLSSKDENKKDEQQKNDQTKTEKESSSELKQSNKNETIVDKNEQQSTDTKAIDSTKELANQNETSENEKSDVTSENDKKDVKVKDTTAKGIEKTDFKAKLSLMLSNIETSINILKKQISDNPHAPFLADLYLELGNLHLQKANTLYYIQMERMESDNNSNNKKSFSSVIEASKEAISTYEFLVKNFPDYGKIPEILYYLSLTYNSIDEQAKFLITAEKLIDTYPDTKEAMQVRMLKGDFLYRKGEYQDALKIYTPVSESSFNYVKNQAIYNMANIFVILDNNKKALEYYRMVILDEELEKDGGIKEISIKNRELVSSLKREALLDSVRAFTTVYPDYDHPEIYYAKIAPTEALYQEVIEKLAFRYIDVKKYNKAITLLRVLSERTADPEKIINIYQNVLTIIPLSERVNIQVDEIKFVLERFYMWFSYYKLSDELKSKALKFIELQIRELGTRNHDIAKKLKGEKREFYFKKAIDFYQLYLGFFKKSENSIKIAVNVADSFYNIKNYPESGNYYLRLAGDQFGESGERKKEFIENALHSLQMKIQYSFYENTWRRGLLIAAINRYFELDSTKKNSDELNFILAKTEFEQGMYEKALNSLYLFAKNFPNSKYVVDSGELILSYFNTSGDYDGLSKWSKKLLSINFKDREFKDKLERIRKQSKLKTLDKDVQSDQEYDAFYQSRSYYKFALSTKDKELRTIALEQALQKSREERDIEQFFKTALYLGKKEKDLKKKLEIYNSVSNEYIYTGRFISALKLLKSIYKNKDFQESDKKEAYIKAFGVVIALKYYKMFPEYMKEQYFTSISDELKEQLIQTIISNIESGIKTDKVLIEYLVKNITENSQVSALYKNRELIKDKSALDVIDRKTIAICKDDEEESICFWKGIEKVEKDKESFLSDILKASLEPSGIATFGEKFVRISGVYNSVMNSDDNTLRVYAIVQTISMYNALADYLKRVADKNSSIKDELLAKAQQSLGAKKEYSDICSKIVQNSETFVSIGGYCSNEKPLKYEQVFSSKNGLDSSSDIEEKNLKDSVVLQKQMLADKNGDSFLDLANSYLKSKEYNMANATAVLGISLFPTKTESFTAILGCSSLGLGHYNESKYHLLAAGDYEGIKDECLEELRKKEVENDNNN